MGGYRLAVSPYDGGNGGGGPILGLGFPQQGRLLMPHEVLYVLANGAVRSLLQGAPTMVGGPRPTPPPSPPAAEPWPVWTGYPGPPTTGPLREASQRQQLRRVRRRRGVGRKEQDESQEDLFPEQAPVAAEPSPGPSPEPQPAPPMFPFPFQPFMTGSQTFVGPPAYIETG